MTPPVLLVVADRRAPPPVLIEEPQFVAQYGDPLTGHRFSAIIITAPPKYQGDPDWLLQAVATKLPPR